MNDLKTKFFLKRMHTMNTSDCIAVYVFIAMAFWGTVLLRGYDILKSILVFMTISILLVLAEKWFSGIGLYIDGNEIYFKVFRCLYYNAEDIAAIKIMKAHRNESFRGDVQLKNKDGSSKYTAIYLKSIEEQMPAYEITTGNESDLLFMQRFNKHILFTSVYDREAIDYLCSLNKNIEVINLYSSEMR